MAELFHHHQKDTGKFVVDQIVEKVLAPVDRLVADMGPLAEWTAPLLKALVASTPADRKEGLHARLALLPTHPAVSGELIAYLPHCRPDELATVRGALRPHARLAADRLWPILLDEFPCLTHWI